jgi:hypothetical protein
VVAHRLDGPARDERGGGLQDVPELFDEAVERLALGQDRIAVSSSRRASRRRCCSSSSTRYSSASRRLRTRPPGSCTPPVTVVWTAAATDQSSPRACASRAAMRAAISSSTGADLAQVLHTGHGRGLRRHAGRGPFDAVQVHPQAGGSGVAQFQGLLLIELGAAGACARVLFAPARVVVEPVARRGHMQPALKADRAQALAVPDGFEDGLQVRIGRAPLLCALALLAHQVLVLSCSDVDGGCGWKFSAHGAWREGSCA